MNLNGKVALITGGTRGIGKGIALQLSKEGVSVILNYKSDDEAAEQVMNEIKNLGGYALLIKGDVSDYKFCNNMIEEVIAKFGKLDILVNNAGISKVGLFIDATEEEWDTLMNTNIKGVFNCCHSVVKHMLSKKRGNIINISSIWGNVGASCEVMYSASKGAINSFTKALAKELAPSNIRVNAISPGVIDTSMNKWLSEEEIRDLVQEIPMMRFGEASDIGDLVAFLVSDKAKYITGQILNIDGGLL